MLNFIKQKLECLAMARTLGIAISLCCAGLVHAQSPCAAPANAIVAENCLTGNPSSEWDISGSGAGDPTIQGFSTDISVATGGTINFKIKTNASAYSINIYRMGYYGGMGARKVATITPSAALPQSQPACLSDPATAMTDCGNWSVSASWAVPVNATSGIYFAHLIRNDTQGDSHIVFIVRNDTSTSDILFQTSDPTWVAYNYYGNGSLYGPGTPSFSLPSRTYAVSYNRPIMTRGFDPESNTFVFGAEFPMVQWLEANGYDVSYFSGIDTARYGNLITRHKVFMDVGHDEYVAGPARANIEAARDAGVNLAFFSGNEIFWKTRLGNSIDASNTPNRSIICYKETLAFAKLDPQDPPTWTGTWRDPSFSPPGDGGKPENALTGTLFVINGTGNDNMGDQIIQVPQADGKMRFWRNTAAANLAAGASYKLVTGSLGYEWDVDADNGARPAGAFQLSTTTYNFTTDKLLDYGATYGAGAATHHLMMHRAPSGSLIFGAGTINWSWGLNANHDNPFSFSNPQPDINMAQATVNLFADMGAQPASIQPGLQPASASTDTAAPASVIVSPASGSTVTGGGTITVSGTASDFGGGVVGGVEVSVDGGATWHPALGRSSWSYSWTPSVLGSVTLLSRAVDDSGNLEVPAAGSTVSVTPQTCPCTIFGSNVPTNADSGDGGAIEVGVKFTSDADGSALGVRFYKSAANTGTHVGHIWTSAGQLLGTATFTGESASGWQQVNFSAPIPVTANRTYVVSYYAPVGHYSADPFYLEQSGHDNPPLHALANGVDGPDGVYVYGSGGGFPAQSYNASHYWVDVIFSSSNTYAITGSISGVGGAGALVSLTGPESLSVSADPSGNFTFNGVVNGNYSITPTQSGVTFSPASQNVSVNYTGVSGVAFTATVTNPLTISGTITGGAGATVMLSGAAAATTTADQNGNYAFTGLLAGSYNVTPSAASYIFNPSTAAISLTSASNTSVNFTGQVCTCVSIFPATTVPSVIDSGDSNSVELGVKFYADSTSTLTGIRFYKSAANGGTHVGHLWSIAGALLGTVNFTGETASGWQQGYFSTPVQLTANTHYVVSYLAPMGHYSADANFFAAAGVDRPPLHALASGVDGGNGVYLYTSSGGFPTGTYNAANYWVDVLYAAQPFSISGTVSGPDGAGASVSLSGTARATTVADANGNYQFNGLFGGAYTVTPTANNAVFSPGNQQVTLSTASITNLSFTEPASCPCFTVWPLTSIPATPDAGDNKAVEVGTKIRPDTAGYVLGIRFYKSTANSGQHVVNLWAADGAAPGSLLGTASASNETASGWQQVLFANPVPVQALATYVASYFAPVGHYAGDANFFATANVDSPPLHALATGVSGPNGVFTYGATSSYPTATFSAANYWVDLIYAPGTTFTIGGVISGAGGANATINLSGTATATTTTDANGNYSFSGLSNGTYTLTPAIPGYSTNPSTQTVTINGNHALRVNFAAALPTFSISGTVAGAPGASLTLSGSATQTATADASGNYVFPSVPAGNYTVTPAATGFTFTPASQNVAVSGTSVTSINFTANPVTFSVTGSVAGAPGATILLSGTASAVADSSGNYTVSGLLPGNYTIVPVPGAGAITSPPSLAVTISNANLAGANFTVPASCPCYTLFQTQNLPAVSDFGDINPTELGVKFSVAADAYVTGVRFYKASLNTGTHLGRLWSSNGTQLGSVTFANESSSGWQQAFFSTPIAVTANATYVISYFAPVGHYSADVSYFASSGVSSPPLQAPAYGVQGPNGVYLASASGGFPTLSYNSNASNYWVDVIETPASTYTIAGAINGAGGAGASVALTGTSSATVTADSSGNYSFSGVANGSYTITPTASGSTFSPASLQATVNNGHVLGLNFTTAVTTYSIAGVISGPGASGATVTLSGASSGSVTTTASGTFSFTGLSNGSYSVAVSNPLFTFTPASQAVTISSANASISFSSVLVTYTLSGTITGPGNSGATVVLGGAASASTQTNASGAYSFTGLANGNYTVTPSLTGYVFTPASQSVTVNNANATASFASAGAAIYSISGTITGPGNSGATVVLGGAASASTQTNASGAYSFTGLANGNYTVAPSLTGYVFTPASQSVAVSNANATANFASAAAAIYSITGTISGAGGPGATVSLSGTSSAASTATSTGAFSFTGLTNGNYTVSVAKSGYSFTPPSLAVTIAAANQTAAFTSTANVFTITGTMSGAVRSGVTVTLTGTAAATTTTNSSGAYSFTALGNGNYTVTPALAGYVFAPVNTAVAISGASKTANFTSTKQTYTLSGTISGPGGASATVKFTGTASGSAAANSQGAFSFPGLSSGNYTVTVTKAGYTFSPTSQAVTIGTANVTTNFTSTANTYTLSGTLSGAGGSGATVSLSGLAAATTTANANGAYSFAGLLAGLYTVTPAKSGYTFSPASQTANITTANATLNFNSAAVTYSIIGTVSGNGKSGATVFLSGTSSGLTTTSSTGSFSFTGLANGSYTVRVFKPGYIFSPASSAIRISGANATASFTSSP